MYFKIQFLKPDFSYEEFQNLMKFLTKAGYQVTCRPFSDSYYESRIEFTGKKIVTIPSQQIMSRKPIKSKRKKK